MTDFTKFGKFPHLETWKGGTFPAGTEWAAKIKLHGTNAAVRFQPDGSIVAQSRNRDLTIEADNNGFCAWVHARSDFWSAVARHNLRRWPEGFVIYGEWAGPGIQSGEAVHKLHQRTFFPFAVLTPEGWLYPAAVEFSDLLPYAATDVIPIPFHGIVTWNPSEDAERLSELVERIGERDPFMAMLGYEGPGEGIVFYPFNADGSPGDPSLIFKAKSRRHTERKGEPAVRRAPCAPAGSVDAFLDRFLTDARLEKAGAEVGFARELTGAFLKYVSEDVLRECQDDLGTLPWKAIAGPLAKRAKDWYFTRL